MTGEDDGWEPGGGRWEPGGGGREPGDPRPHSQSLAQELTILAQFGNQRVVLDQTEVARLTDCTCSISRRCLLTLSALGYLTEAHDGGYRLAGGEVHLGEVHRGELDLIDAQRSEDGTADTAA